MDLIEGLMTTRAMRRYTDEPVSDEDIWTILRAAQQGPSGGNIQPWQFVVATDADVRARLGEIYRASYLRYEAAMLAASPPRRPEEEASWQRTIAASRHLADHFGEAPVIVAAAMADISMDVTDADGVMDVGTPYASVYPALQNLMLAARALGLGSALTTVFRVRHDEVREALEVPDRYQVVALIPIGHPTGSFGRAPRRPVEKVTHWNRWGERRAAPPDAVPSD
ncbi:MAG: nitroreductase family protein [Acidimicrobiales bacterium]